MRPRHERDADGGDDGRSRERDERAPARVRRTVQHVHPTPMDDERARDSAQEHRMRRLVDRHAAADREPGDDGSRNAAGAPATRPIWIKTPDALAARSAALDAVAARVEPTRADDGTGVERAAARRDGRQRTCRGEPDRDARPGQKMTGARLATLDVCERKAVEPPCERHHVGAGRLPAARTRPQCRRRSLRARSARVSSTSVPSGSAARPPPARDRRLTPAQLDARRQGQSITRGEHQRSLPVPRVTVASAVAQTAANQQQRHMLGGNPAETSLGPASPRPLQRRPSNTASAPRLAS